MIFREGVGQALCVICLRDFEILGFYVLCFVFVFDVGVISIRDQFRVPLRNLSLAYRSSSRKIVLKKTLKRTYSKRTI